jgi:hypothetical protein
MSSTQRQSYIDILAAHSVPTDGMILHRGKLYMADLPGEGIWEFTIESRRGRTLPLCNRFDGPTALQRHPITASILLHHKSITPWNNELRMVCTD